MKRWGVLENKRRNSDLRAVKDPDGGQLGKSKRIKRRIRAPVSPTLSFTSDHCARSTSIIVSHQYQSRKSRLLLQSCRTVNCSLLPSTFTRGTLNTGESRTFRDLSILCCIPVDFEVIGEGITREARQTRIYRTVGNANFQIWRNHLITVRARSHL